MGNVLEVEVDASVKRNVDVILETRGITLSGAVNRFLRKVSQEPEFLELLEDRIPNDEVLEAMAELKAGKGKSFNTVAELMADLNADD